MSLPSDVFIVMKLFDEELFNFNIPAVVLMVPQIIVA